MPLEDPDNLIDFDDLGPEELEAFNNILRRLWELRGVDFRQYRPRCLRRRVVVGMHDANAENFAQYFVYLQKHPEKYNELLERITINVSEFFRNPETFRAVRAQVIPELIRQKQNSGTTIRVWSSGCATGEEPYSLAIMFKEVLTEQAAKLNVQIFATDIDNDALRQAKEGVYKEKSLRVFKPSQLKQYFEKNDAGTYRINPEIQSLVKFREHNMISDEPLSRVDLIFCRNVIIYFTKELQKKVYENFFRALLPGGYFVAGKTESLMDISMKEFERIDLEERILRKKKGMAPRDENT